MDITESSHDNLNRHQISEQNNTSIAISEIFNNFFDSSKDKLKRNDIKDDTKKDNSNNIFVKIVSNSLYLSLLILFMGTAYLFLALLLLKREIAVENIYQFLRFAIFILGSLTGLLLWRVYKDFIETIENTKKKAIKRAGTYNTNSYYEVINILGTQFKQKDLNNEEIKYKLIINERKHRKNILIKVIPAFAIIIVLSGFIAFGIPSYSQITNQFFNAFLSVSGIVTIVKIGLDVYNELLSQDIDVIYERCVLILQNAQNIAKEIESNKDSSSINRNIKGKNLLRELRKIKIKDAPSDFSSNFDFYRNDDK